MDDRKILFLYNILLKGDIAVKTGLHIGGTKDTLEIGGMDNPIIKDPISGMPYIPGSSIKGKLRCLLELENGLHERGGVHSKCADFECFVCRLFGNSKNTSEPGPTRLLVRDCNLNHEKTRRNIQSPVDKKITSLEIIEDKYENTIDRLTSSATPRPVERVVPGAVFTLELVYRVFDCGDDGKTDLENLEYLKRAIDLLHEDYLGGNGSRGYGKVEFRNIEITCSSERGKRQVDEIFQNYLKTTKNA